MYGDLVRAAHGTATIYASFDFETRSHAGFLRSLDGGLESLPGMSDQNRGLKAVGVVNYVSHPTFRPISLQYDLKDGKGCRIWRWGDPPPWDLHVYVRAGGIIQSWNASFEWWVWQLYCVPRLGWPPLAADQLRCVMAKARVFSLPGALDDAGSVLKLHNRKDPAGEKLIRKLTTPKRYTKTDRADFWEPDTAPRDFFDFAAYGIGDILSESEASTRIPDLTEHELEIWRFDQTCNRRGMQIDSWNVENCVAIVEQCILKYHARLIEITNGAVRTASENAKALAWMRTVHGVYLANMDEETVAEALEDPPKYPPAVMEVLQIRQKLAFGSVKKLYAMRYHSTPSGRLHDQYLYSAARTRRWNGQAVQPTNLYSGEFNTPEEIEEALAVIATRSLARVEAYYGGDALEIVANCLRSMIIAAPGKQLICSDFSSIEAVTLACMAGEQWRIDEFRGNGLIYERTLADMIGVPYEEIVDWPRTHDGKKHPLRKTHGKIPELSGGYQAWIGGWKKFGAGKIWSDKEIKAKILKWRARSPMIEELWGGQTRDKFKDSEREELFGLEGAAIKAVKNPGICYGYRGILYQVDPAEDILYCRPPSGELLPYHSPRLEQSTRDYATPWEKQLYYSGWNSNAAFGAKGWVQLGLYGGKLTENLNQHVCREIQAGALVRCERAGYSIVMHTHDEACAEVEKGWGSVEGIEQLMTPIEEWAAFPDGSRWPIRAKGGWSGPRYGKWE